MSIKTIQKQCDDFYQHAVHCLWGNLSLQAQCDQLTTQITKVMGSKYFESPSSTTNQPLYLTTDLHLEIIQKAESAEDHNLNLTKAMHDIVLKSHAINNVKAKLLSNLLEKHTFAMASQGLKQIAFNASNPAPKTCEVTVYIRISDDMPGNLANTLNNEDGGYFVSLQDMARYRNQIIQCASQWMASEPQIKNIFRTRMTIICCALPDSNRRKKLLSDLYNSLHRLLKLFNAGIERLIEGTQREPLHIYLEDLNLCQYRPQSADAPVPLSTSSQPSNTLRRPSGIR